MVCWFFQGPFCLLYLQDMEDTNINKQVLFPRKSQPGGEIVEGVISKPESHFGRVWMGLNHCSGEGGP